MGVEWAESIECPDDVVHWYMWDQIINIKFLILLLNQSKDAVDEVFRDRWIMMRVMHKCKISSKYQRVSSSYAGATAASLGSSISCYSVGGTGSSVSRAY